MADAPPPYTDVAGYPVKEHPTPPSSTSSSSPYPMQSQYYPTSSTAYTSPPVVYSQSYNPGVSQNVGYTTTTMVTYPQPVVMTNYQFRDIPVAMKCPYCSADIVTSLRFDVGALTWLVCVLLCCFGCFLGCCFIPFCMNGCKDVIHSCPNCNRVVGRHSRL